MSLKNINESEQCRVFLVACAAEEALVPFPLASSKMKSIPTFLL